MPWTLVYDEALGIIELSLVGVVSGADLRAATQQGFAMSGELEVVRCIVDATDQEETGTILDLYQLPALYEEVGLDRTARIALLPPTRAELHELAAFYETVCVNRGWSVKVFPTREGAIEWLGA